MKIVLVSTYDINGGASIAAYRLLLALLEINLDAWLLVAHKQSQHERVVSVSDGWIDYQKIHLAAEKGIFLFHEKDKSQRFAFSTAAFGIDISGHPLIQSADVVHFHWFLQGFVSLKTLSAISSNKKVFWTLHDMWAFTGGCHYSGICKNYIEQCGECFYLKNPQKNDLSHKIFLKKQQLYKHIHFITCSRWLKSLAGNSSLLKDAPITAVPNPIDISKYFPAANKKDIQKLKGINPSKKWILFGASNPTDERKGIQYLIQSLQYLCRNKSDYGLIVYGDSSKIKDFETGIETIFTGFLSQSALIDYYQLADVYVIPSLEDNLPNTIMESLSCGTPVVGFDSGGIPEMIDHFQNGYVAKFKDEKDLALGIDWVLNQSEIILSKNARIKAENAYQQKVIAAIFKQLYSK